jgi:hypothetical protein
VWFRVSIKTGLCFGWAGGGRVSRSSILDVDEGGFVRLCSRVGPFEEAVVERWVVL